MAMSCVSTGPVCAYIARSPDSVRHVLLDNSQNYDKRIGHVQMKLGDGLLVSEEILAGCANVSCCSRPPASASGALTMAMTDAMTAMLKRWEVSAAAGEPVNNGAMAQLTHAITGRMLWMDISAAGHSLGQGAS